MLVEYDKYTDKLSVVYYGYGIRIQNLNIGLNGLNNKAVFIDRTVKTLNL